MFIIPRMANPLTPEQIQQFREDYKRCGEAVIEAIISYHSTRDPKLIPEIVAGILQRYLPPSSVDLASRPDSALLVEDLGIDSLTMLEVILSIEEALGVRIDNNELRDIRTLGDVKGFAVHKASAAKASTSIVQQEFSRRELENLLPQGPPFLFLDSARLEGAAVEAVFQAREDGFYFQGHFKDRPVLPAAILCEAMGQAACLYIRKTEHPSSGKHIFVLNIEGAHFRRVVVPSDKVEIRMQLRHAAPPLYHFNGEAKVGGESVAHLERLILASGELQEAVTSDVS